MGRNRNANGVTASWGPLQAGATAHPDLGALTVCGAEAGADVIAPGVLGPLREVEDQGAEIDSTVHCARPRRHGVSPLERGCGEGRGSTGLGEPRDLGSTACHACHLHLYGGPWSSGQLRGWRGEGPRSRSPQTDPARPRCGSCVTLSLKSRFCGLEKKMRLTQLGSAGVSPAAPLIPWCGQRGFESRLWAHLTV